MGRPLLPQIFNTNYQAGKLRKTLSFFLVNLLFLFATQAQTITIPVGNADNDPANNNISRKPLGSYRGFERSAMIYTSTEIGTSGTITSIGFYLNALSSPAASTPVVIFMKQTSATQFAAPTTVTTEESGATVVFNGNITSGMLSVNNWVTIPLSPTFTYSTASNLEIIVETNAGGSGNEADSAKNFNFQNTGLNQFQYWQSDGGSPESFGFTGVLSTYRPNVQLTFGTASQPCNPPTALTATNVTSTTATLGFTGSSTGSTGTYTVQYGLDGFADGAGTTATSPYNLSGLTPNTVYDFTVQKNCGSNGNSSIVRGTFTTLESCDPPTNLSVTNITSSSASLNFTTSSTGGSGTYTVEYGPTGFTPGSGTSTTGVTTSPLNISGLSAGTTYQFYVTKNCGTTLGNSTRTGPVSFTTSAAAQTCDPATGLTASNITTSSATLSFTGSSTGATGTYTVQYGPVGFLNGSGTTVSGPPYNVSGLTPNTTYDFTVQKDCGTNGTSTFARAQFTTSATAQTCDPATALTATNVTSTTATLGFTGSSTGSTGTYTVQYGLDGFADGTGTTVASPYNLSGLTPNTIYDFTVQKNCGSNGNSSIVRGTFTTSAAAQACEPPTNLNATNVTNTSASLSFNVSNTGFTGTYTVEYGLSGFTPGTGTSVSGLTASPYNATNLTPNRAYQFYVYKNCGANGTSNFAGPASFTTTNVAATCDAPTVQATTNITNTTAQINFTPSSTGAAGTYVLEYGPDGFSLGSGTIISNITSSPYTLTGLTSDQDYDFYLRKNCGSTGFSTNAAGSFTTLTSPPACVAGTWTGTVSTNWHTAGNWCNSQLPTSTTNVIIPSGTPFSPVITANAETRSLTINSGATLTLTGPSPNPPTINALTLTINGLFTNNGTFTNTNGDGTIIFTSNDLQTIGQSGQTTVFFDLTTGPGGANMAGPVSIRHLLTLNGSLNTNSQTFTLLADAAFQAMVTNNNGTVNGTAIMERYINPGENQSIGYRHLSSPVANTTIADLADPGVSLVINPAYNASATPSTVRPFPTIFRYNETRLTPATTTTSAFTFGWESPTALSNPMTPGRAFTVYMPPVEINFNGTLNNGNISVGPLTRGVTANSGWHFLGNPYPSPIDWDLATVPAGLDNAIYVFRSRPTAYTGYYVSYVNGVGDANTDLVASCQGFFVRVNSGTPTFNFTNSMRVATYQNPALYRKTETRPLIALELKNQNGESDKAYVYFENGASPAFDSNYDAYKLPNSGTAPILYSLVNTEAVSINGLPLPTANTLVPLGAWVNAAGTFTFNASKILNLTGAPVILEDRQTGTFINLQQQPSYTFTTSQQDLTGRFFLRFSPGNTTGMPENGLAARTLVYPNPNRGEFTLSIQLKESKTVEANLVNAIGQHVWAKTFKPNSLHLKENVTLDKLPAGIYMLAIKTSEGVIQKKLVIE